MIVTIDEDCGRITRVPIPFLHLTKGLNELLAKLANLGMPRPVKLRPQSGLEIVDTWTSQFFVYLGETYLIQEV